MPPKTSINTDPQTKKRTRCQTQVLTSNPQPEPTQPPIYQRFKSKKAEERYQEIKERDFVGEQAFDVINLTGHPTFETTLREKGWEGLNDMVTKTINKSIALEFFANAYVEPKKNYFAIVRGKEVSYASRDNNCLLGLPVLEVCDVERRRNPMSYPNSHEE